MLERVPNQKIIKIKKAKADKNNPYYITNRSSLEKALVELIPSEFKLWSYFGKNQDNYSFYFSSTIVANACGLTVPTIQKAVRGLISKGYLVRCESNRNLYEFRENGKDNFI